MQIAKVSARAACAPGKFAHVPKIGQLPANLSNQALLRRVQAKLAIRGADDPLEREAEAVADRVTQAAAPSSALTPAPIAIGRKCSACQDDDLLSAKQSPADLGAQSGETSEADVADVLRQSGTPIAPADRNFFETRFGTDFSAVRIHTGTQAARSARGIEALAYTVGQDVVFGDGHYQPGTPQGRQLIAHELAHTIQQRAADGMSAIQRAPEAAGPPLVLPCPVAPDSARPDEVLLFANNDSDLSPEQKVFLGNVALNWNVGGATGSVRIDGYASLPGEDALNWALSCNRASAVRNELANPSSVRTPGIPAASLPVFMHGETNEFGAEAQNRRATLELPAPPARDPTPAPTPAPKTDQKPPVAPQEQAAPGEAEIICGNPKCEKSNHDYCRPFPTKQAALADRSANGESVLSSIGSACSRAVPMFRKFVFNPAPAGDISGEFSTDFTNDLATRDATMELVDQLAAKLNASPPTFPVGQNEVVVNISTVLGEPTITKLVEDRMVFTNPLAPPGLFAGGVGKTQTACLAGANTQGAVNDSRAASGTLRVFKNPDGTLVLTPTINYTVVDTIDFCPGNCGGWPGTTLTVPLSRWEASGISGDVPFTVHFPAPSIVGSVGSED